MQKDLRFGCLEQVGISDLVHCAVPLLMTFDCQFTDL